MKHTIVKNEKTGLYAIMRYSDSKIILDNLTLEDVKELMNAALKWCEEIDPIGKTMTNEQFEKIRNEVWYVKFTEFSAKWDNLRPVFAEEFCAGFTAGANFARDLFMKENEDLKAKLEIAIDKLRIICINRYSEFPFDIERLSMIARETLEKIKE